MAFLMKFHIYIYDNIFCMENQEDFFFLAVLKIGNRRMTGLDFGNFLWKSGAVANRTYRTWRKLGLPI